MAWFGTGVVLGLWCIGTVEGQLLPEGGVVPEGLTFNCDVDWTTCYQCLLRKWSLAKRTYCCETKKRGCATTPLPATTSLPFDCNADYVNCYHCLERKWSVAKRSWCCAHGGRGCTTPPPPPATTSLPYDCNADYINCYHCMMKRWSVTKRAYCCAHGGRGCSTPAPKKVVPPPPPKPTTTSLPYDCDADYMNCYHCMMKRWSVTKRAYCCAHGGRGCTTTAAPTTTPHFDCNAGWSNWQLGWSDDKKAWCCQKASKGCPDQSTTPCPPMDCNVAWGNWQAAWSDKKKAFCCQHQHKGCPPVTPPPPAAAAHPPATTTNCPPMDCTVAFNNWEAAWSVKKKAYCCQHERKGCPPSPPPPEGHPVPAAPPTTSKCPPMDCNVAFNNWRLAWGPLKKEFCCKTMQRGCEGTPPPAPPVRAAAPPGPPAPPTTSKCPPMDCGVAFNNWQAAWGPLKKAYCCEHFHKGCEGKPAPAAAAPPPAAPATTPCPPIDCNVAWNNWQAAWGPTKKAFCCEKFHKGCPPAPPAPAAVITTPPPPPPTTSKCPPMDCNVAFNNWQVAWGDAKKAYCCQHENKGCQNGAVGMPAAGPPATTPCPPQDCNAAFANWQAAWTPQKKAWCCAHAGKGCTGMMVPFQPLRRFEEEEQVRAASRSSGPAQTMILGGLMSMVMAACLAYRWRRRPLAEELEPMVKAEE